MKKLTIVVRARVNADVKDQAIEVLESMGLTVSDAIRLMMTRVARDRKIPFDLGEPPKDPS